MYDLRRGQPGSELQQRALYRPGLRYLWRAIAQRNFGWRSTGAMIAARAGIEPL